MPFSDLDKARGEERRCAKASSDERGVGAAWEAEAGRMDPRGWWGGCSEDCIPQVVFLQSGRRDEVRKSFLATPAPSLLEVQFPSCKISKRNELWGIKNNIKGLSPGDGWISWQSVCCVDMRTWFLSPVPALEKGWGVFANLYLGRQRQVDIWDFPSSHLRLLISKF